MKQSGNVLFLILIAVALFAALSYAVTQSASSEGNDVSDEQTELMASRLLQRASIVKASVDRMRLIHQCNDTEISFENDIVEKVNGDPYYTSSDHTTSTRDKCKVYHPDGGGLDPVIFTDMIDQDTASSLGAGQPEPGTERAIDSNFTDIGTSDPELIMSVSPIKESICLKLNEMIGITNPSGDVPVDNIGGSNQKYFGDYDGTGELGNAQSAADFLGRNMACFDNGGNAYGFSYLLIAR